MMRNFYQKGVSLVEILLVVAVLVVLILIVSPSFSSIRDSQLLKGAVGDVLSSLDKARAQTLSSLNSSEYGVHFQADKVIIFKGQVFSAGAIDNESINIISPTAISNVTLGGVSNSTGDLYFNRLSGSPNMSGTVTITLSSVSKIINISATGFASMD